jgi:virginiamycin B lyase
MRPKHLSLLASASLFGLVPAGATGALAQTTAQAAAALTGQVTSGEEGAMEGVLVSARKDGSTITVTVVTDANGQYSFPADRLGAGHYALTIRAAGYNLDAPTAVDIADGAPKADIRVVKTKNLANQLSNAEWLLSAPGPDNLKANMTNCVSCHTLQRVFSSSHDAEEFKQIFQRMGGYSPGSTPAHPQRLLPGPRGDRSPMPPSQWEAMSNWLASVDLSTTYTRPYELQTLPRPKGAATKVIYTEYDLPRKETQPHDVIVDQDGMVWYSDFSNQFAGVLDPKTGKATDIPIPVLKPEEPRGSLEIELDGTKKNVWLAMMYQAGVARIDRLTHQVTTYAFPKEWQSTSAQASMVSPQHDDVDGKVWTNNQDVHNVYRLDVNTGQFENLGPSTDPRGKQIAAYGMPTDHQNNVYQLEFGGTSIGLRDAKTLGATIYATPIKNSRPRRGRVDEQNRLWFAEFGGNAVGLFDPETAAIKEYPIPTKFSAPYDAAPNKDASQVWTGSMLDDRVARVDTKSGQVTEFLLPRSTNIRRVFVQDNGPKTVLWVGNNHGGEIIKVEPLD